MSDTTATSRGTKRLGSSKAAAKQEPTIRAKDNGPAWVAEEEELLAKTVQQTFAKMRQKNAPKPAK